MPLINRMFEKVSMSSNRKGSRLQMSRKSSSAASESVEGKKGKRGEEGEGMER